MIERRDIAHACAVFLIAACLGMVFVASWDGTPHFFQELFGPAVLFACGQGFANPDLSAAPALDTFLHPEMHVSHPPEIDRFDPADLPPDLRTTPLGSFQSRQRYLIFAAGLVWRVLGVAWSALLPLYGLLFGASAAVLYLLFRLAAPGFLAWPITLLLITSPIQLNNLARLRDYSKAPFLLGAILILAWLIRQPFSPRRLWGFSALFGAVIGIGMGFRMDVLIALPAYVLVVLFLLDAPLLGHLRAKAVAVMICAAVFVATGFPILAAMGTSMKYQDFMLGLNTLYDGRLGVGGVPYQINHRYLDFEPFATLEAHAIHLDGEPGFYEWDTPEVEAAGRRYTREILRTFPADIVTRCYAAVLRTVDELHSSTRHAAPRGISDRFVLWCYGVHAFLVEHLFRYARYATALALLMLAAHRLRLGFGALFLLLYFGGYGAVQFASRHYFHMQFLAYWAVACCLGLAWAVARAYWQKRHGGAEAWTWEPLPALKRVGIFAGLTLVGILGPVWGLRFYQAPKVEAVLSSYEAAPRSVLRTRTRATAEGAVLVQGVDGAGRDVLPPDDPYFAREFLVAEFDTRDAPVPFIARYEGANHDLAFTRHGEAPRASGPVRVYFPAYYSRWHNTGGWTRYLGLELSPENAARLKVLSRVETPEAFPLLLTATLPPDWREGPLWQHFTR